MVNAGLLNTNQVNLKKKNKNLILRKWSLFYIIIFMTIKHSFTIKFKISQLNSEQQIIPMINTCSLK